MVEIIPKEVPQLPKWLSIVFYVSLGLLIFSIISHFILAASLSQKEKEKESLEKQIAAFQTPERQTLEEEVLKYEQKIEYFSKLAREHLNSSEIFSFIQSKSHPEVWFNDFSFDPREGKVAVSGVTSGFDKVGQQILILEKEELVQQVELEEISLEEEEGVRFTFSINLKQETFTPYLSGE